MSTLPDKLIALEDVLFEAGILNEEQRDEIKDKLSTIDKPVEKLLIDDKYAMPNEIALAKDSIELGIKCISLEDSPPDEAAIEKLAAKFAFDNSVAPVRLEDNVLTVAMADPLDVLLRDDIRLLTGCEVQPLLATEDDIQDALRIYYGRTADQIISEAKTPGGIAVAQGIEEISDYYQDDTLAGDPTVKEAIDQLIIDAVNQDASDIHIEPFARHVQIRYRIDGVLEKKPDPPRELQWALISRVKIMAKMDIAQKRFPQDGKITRTITTLGNREIDIRVSTVPIQWGESLVLRILDKKTISYGLEQLGLMEDNYAQFQKMIQNPHGIILATGPTGSGKTTTLYACLKEINQPGATEVQESVVSHVMLHHALLQTVL